VDREMVAKTVGYHGNRGFAWILRSAQNDTCLFWPIIIVLRKSLDQIFNEAVAEL
jgi:hypothetical protein